MASPDLSVPEDRRCSGLDQLPPPASSNKPLTPFSIEDILSKPTARRSGAAGHSLPGHSLPGHSLPARALRSHTSPLCALEELASKTFRGLEVSVLQAAEGRDCVSLFGEKNAPKKRRKSRTAFTNHQIYELEKRFLHQKYLSPADRDRIAQQLGLTNAQVITWFQNRRAKLKRDLEEMRADVESAKAVGAVAFEKLSRLAELEKCAAGGGASGRTICVPGYIDRDQDQDRDLDRASSRPLLRTTGSLESGRTDGSPSQRPVQRSCSEDEEIDVDD